MSTKSLDLSLPLQHVAVDSGTPQAMRDFKTKIDLHQLQNYDQIGQKLIDDHLLLSALELYAEVAEAGYEVPCLKQFFSNPGNFEKTVKNESTRLLVRSLSQATLDSLEFAPLSEDGDRMGEDRVAVLEFELRKAKETIMALRENLTSQVEQENPSTRSETDSNCSQNNPISKPSSSGISFQLQSCIPEPIRAYEQRAINFLVHEYLLTHGYRLSSITFADENAEQDFENWDDVGLNIERPADLLSMFRQVHRSRSSQQPAATTEDVETQTDISVDNEEADVTMQFTGCSAEDSVAADIISAKPTNSSSTANDIPAASEPSVSTAEPSTSVPTASVESPNIFPHSSAHLQNTARAFKEELQQGVGDVYQKLNQFFSKPNIQSQSHSNSTNRATLTSPITGFLTKTPTDRTSFPLFQNK